MRVLILLVMLFSSSAYFTDVAKITLFEATAQIPTESLITLTYTNTDKQYQPTELINNGTFVSGLSSWNQEGAVALEENCFAEFSCVRMGDAAISKTPAVISQEIVVGDNQPATVTLKIKTQSTETLPGFDSPYFVILVDNTPVYEEHFSTVLPLDQWRQITVPLPDLPPGTHTLVFKQQNTGDSIHVPIIALSAVSTQPIVLGINDTINLETNGTDGQIELKLLTPAGSEYVSGDNEVTLSPAQLLNVTKIEYWLTQAGSAASEPVSIPVHQDTTVLAKPRIIAARREEDNQLTLLVEKPFATSNYQVQIIDQNESIITTVPVGPARRFRTTDIITMSLPEGNAVDTVRIRAQNVVGKASTWSGLQQILSSSD